MSPPAVTIALQSLKISVALQPAQMPPRSILPAEGQPGVDHELLFALEGSPGQPALVLRGKVHTKVLRRAFKAMDDLAGADCLVLVGGRMTGSGELKELGFTVQARTPKAPPAPA